MKANELRIGNYVQHQLSGELIIIKAEHIEQLEFGMDQDILQGIVLNEEWLIKLGFDKKTYSSGHPQYFLRLKNCNHTISAIEFSGKARISIVNQTIATINNVHTLQNLIYSLTGE